jgi:selenium metabolism protein YedF
MVSNGERPKRVVLVLDSDVLGSGDAELGAMLMPNFLRNIAFQDPPETVLCYNRGVWLATKDSPALPFLEAIAEKGSEVVCCGTCVDFFKVKEQIAVGRIGDMRGIVDAINAADKVVYA